MNQNNTHTKIQVCRTIDFWEQNQYDCVIIYLKYFAIQVLGYLTKDSGQHYTTLIGYDAF